MVIADLESEREFATNRTGLVVLHPPQLAGEALRVTHTDGTTEEVAFPRAISPHQPVLDIAQLSWLHAGSEVSVAFDGDVFEMEDQRNWSDASYKTYSRPLAIPFPYTIAAGDRVRQSVQIDVREITASGSSHDPDLVRLAVGRPGVRSRAGRGDRTRSRPRRARAETGGRARRTRPAHAELARCARRAPRGPARRSTCG